MERLYSITKGWVKNQEQEKTAENRDLWQSIVKRMKKPEWCQPGSESDKYDTNVLAFSYYFVSWSSQSHDETSRDNFRIYSSYWQTSPNTSDAWRLVSESGTDGWVSSNNTINAVYHRTTPYICKGISIFCYFGKNGTARPYLSGASSDTERTGCEARIWSCDQTGNGSVTGLGHVAVGVKPSQKVC